MALCSSMEIYKKTFLFAVIYIRLSLGNGKSIAILKDTETSTGDTTTLHCLSSISSIEWHHLPVDSSVHEIVYQDGFIFNGYKERFTVNRKDNGEYNLVIKNVKATDAGKYTCVQKSEVALQKSAQLVVFEQYPSNKFCAAKYTCTPSCDVMELTCSMKSHGNIIPLMEWRESTKGILTFNFKMENGTTISSIHVDLKRSNSDTHSYDCRIKYPIGSSVTTQFSWSYLIAASSAPASLTPSSSSDEKPRFQNIETFIAITTSCLMAIALAGMIVGFLILLNKNKRLTFRKTAELANLTTQTRCAECSPYDNIEIGPVSESKNLLTPGDQDDNSSGTVPSTPLNTNKSAFGIGVLDDEIFLLNRNPYIILVLDLVNVKFKRCWTVDGLINPNNIATCPAKRLLFISDWKKDGEHSEIVCCDKDGKLKYRWSSKNKRSRISITKETNVIVTENCLNTINEYTESGERIKTLSLEGQMLPLWHATKLENGNFVICFGVSQDEIQEISIIDSHGAILHSLDYDSIQKFPSKFSAPIALTVDQERCVGVWDLDNFRIILLTPELKFRSEINPLEAGARLRGHIPTCFYESENKCKLLTVVSINIGGGWIDNQILEIILPPLKKQAH